jgi:hypothetical protein
MYSYPNQWIEMGKGFGGPVVGPNAVDKCPLHLSTIKPRFLDHPARTPLLYTLQ